MDFKLGFMNTDREDKLLTKCHQCERYSPLCVLRWTCCGAQSPALRPERMRRGRDSAVVGQTPSEVAPEASSTHTLDCREKVNTNGLYRLLKLLLKLIISLHIQIR